MSPLKSSSVAPIVQGVTITSHRPIPSTPWFFDWIFDSVSYRQWKDINSPTRLLRIVGGPGSGKTSFATLAVKQLEQQDNDRHALSQKPSIVLSVFLKSLDIQQSPGAAVRQEQNNIPFSVQFLAEIERQLDVALKLDSILTPPTSPQDQTAEAIVGSILFKLHRFSDIYLVVDDIDCLWTLPNEYLKVEEQLEVLRSRGVRVLITSRTAFQSSCDEICCDIPIDEDEDDRTHDPEEEFGELVTWWSCDHEAHGEEGFAICSNCKAAGFGCADSSHQAPTLHTRPVTLDMSGAPRDAMSTFVVHHLQLEHGHFWDIPLDPCPWDAHDLGAPKRAYPPLSPLGKRLVSTVPDEVSSDAETIVGRIIDASSNNISTALLRLELVHQAQSLDDILYTRDRLPANIVDFFHGLVAKYVQEKLGEEFPLGIRVRAALAVHAIRTVGEQDMISGILWEDLKDILTEKDDECGHGFTEILEQEFGMQELLGAAGGLLTVKTTSAGCMIKCFHFSFHKYVDDRYDEFLAGGECGRIGHKKGG
ncbi:hypothetical protein QBC43DRAFT_293501 [Cladorrhinum sp. PSN259]|nr:hypothetical protein QBC43DRAFT_293501 [Cladorrhinum sp. PSN259]